MDISHPRLVSILTLYFPCSLRILRFTPPYPLASEARLRILGACRL